jgi:hypothetical protein
VIDDAVCFIDVLERAISQPAYGWIIFFAGDIVVRLVQQLQSAMKAPSAIHVGIHGRMIAQILTIINRSPFNFVNGSVDLGDGVLFFFVHVIGGGRVLQMSARMAKVGERVQVGRMPSRFVSKGNRGANREKKHEYGTVSYSFHSLLEKPFGRVNSVYVNTEQQALTRRILAGSPAR